MPWGLKRHRKITFRIFRASVFLNLMSCFAIPDPSGDRKHLHWVPPHGFDGSIPYLCPCACSLHPTTPEITEEAQTKHRGNYPSPSPPQAQTPSPSNGQPIRFHKLLISNSIGQCRVLTGPIDLYWHANKYILIPVRLVLDWLLLSTVDSVGLQKTKKKRKSICTRRFEHRWCIVKWGRQSPMPCQGRGPI